VLLTRRDEQPIGQSTQIVGIPSTKKKRKEKEKKEREREAEKRLASEVPPRATCIISLLFLINTDHCPCSGGDIRSKNLHDIFHCPAQLL
jgi:hypothetical protein